MGLVAGLLLTATGCGGPVSGEPVVVEDPAPPAEVPGEIAPAVPDEEAVADPAAPTRRRMRPACECGLS